MKNGPAICPSYERAIYASDDKPSISTSPVDEMDPQIRIIRYQPVANGAEYLINSSRCSTKRCCSQQTGLRVLLDALASLAPVAPIKPGHKKRQCAHVLTVTE